MTTRWPLVNTSHSSLHPNLHARQPHRKEQTNQRIRSSSQNTIFQKTINQKEHRKPPKYVYKFPHITQISFPNRTASLKSTKKVQKYTNISPNPLLLQWWSFAGPHEYDRQRTKSKKKPQEIVPNQSVYKAEKKRMDNVPSIEKMMKSSKRLVGGRDYVEKGYRRGADDGACEITESAMKECDVVHPDVAFFFRKLIASPPIAPSFLLEVVLRPQGFPVGRSTERSMDGRMKYAKRRLLTLSASSNARLRLMIVDPLSVSRN